MTVYHINVAVGHLYHPQNPGKNNFFYDCWRRQTKWGSPSHGLGPPPDASPNTTNHWTQSAAVGCTFPHKSLHRLEGTRTQCIHLKCEGHIHHESGLVWAGGRLMKRPLKRTVSDRRWIQGYSHRQYRKICLFNIKAHERVVVKPKSQWACYVSADAQWKVVKPMLVSYYH